MSKWKTLVSVGQIFAKWSIMDTLDGLAIRIGSFQVQLQMMNMPELIKMSSERYGDTDLVYWMGRSINAMTREELQVALGEAVMAIENLRQAEFKLFLKAMELKYETHSRFTNPDYLASFC